MKKQTDNLFQSRKGQSAIEYLMTYGWMLLVVAIVGGAIFATVQGQCAKSATGFTGESVTIASKDDFGATGSNLQIDFTNGASEEVNITKVSIMDDDGNTVDSNSTSMVLNVGDTGKYVFGSINEADSCNNYDVEISFDKGSISGQTAKGSISGQMSG